MTDEPKLLSLPKVDIAFWWSRLKPAQRYGEFIRVSNENEALQRQLEALTSDIEASVVKILPSFWTKGDCDSFAKAIASRIIANAAARDAAKEV